MYNPAHTGKPSQRQADLGIYQGQYILCARASKWLWGGREQALMRRASVLGGLIPNTPSGNARVSFVTEREASLHFAIQHNVLSGHRKASTQLFYCLLTSLILLSEIGNYRC